MEKKLEELRKLAEKWGVRAQVAQMGLPEDDPRVKEIIVLGWVSEAKGYLERLKSPSISIFDRKRFISLATYCAKRAKVRVEDLAKDVGVEI